MDNYSTTGITNKANYLVKLDKQIAEFETELRLPITNARRKFVKRMLSDAKKVRARNR